MLKKEYIEREAALILCQDFIDSHEDGSWCWVKAVTDKDIMKIPIADVVQVVRCRDCKHLYCHSAVDRMFYCNNYPHGLKGTINIIEENPYCCYGERKM